ncbi:MULTISPECIES: AzlD domain-containing protein [Massilia]|jgi:branched-subunit amino acid transport protein|uniref:AzlD domain-containing protein n=1 Tax=Massilia orientalis TaxID=3050128 RepID=A0ACC7MLC7_9BURK|nr:MULTISPECIES: AzlD domain-containing protein [unclassified Massilia]KQY16612.1 branched-chain amino acid transporter [Massilia sp. Root133]KQZ51855.1 branched-chain amino acid transporter [Massilia sp. Root1485]MDN4046453.1 AzlD domain-containing protein [Massilia sp. YIM B02787]
MADWEIWTVIVVLGVATACCRSALWMVGHRVTIPRRVQEMLRYAPACALAAIVAPDFMLGPQGEVELAVTNPKLLAGIISLAYYLWRRNMLQTIVIGMVVFTVLRVSGVFHGVG